MIKDVQTNPALEALRQALNRNRNAQENNKENIERLRSEIAAVESYNSLLLAEETGIVDGVVKLGGFTVEEKRPDAARQPRVTDPA